LIVFYGAFCQDHQTNKKTLSRHLRAVYDVLKSDRKIKDGKYAVLNDAGQHVVDGYYVNGRKTGIWTFYDNQGKLVQQYDFSHDSLLLTNRDPLSIVQFDYQIPQGVDDSSKLQPPYKIGGPEYGFFLLYDERDIPPTVKATSGKAEMTYVLTINEKGNLESYSLIFGGENFNDIVQRHSVKELPTEALDFSPARIDGLPVRSKISYRIPLDINHTSVPGNNYMPTRFGASN
jgi:hypothetical protein